MTQFALRRRRAAAAEPLRRVADDHAHERTGQHDLEPVVRAVWLRDRGDREREDRGDHEADENAFGERVHAIRIPADEDADDEALDGRSNDDADDLRRGGRGEERGVPSWLSKTSGG